MARLLALTEATELATMMELRRLVLGVGFPGTGERIASLLWQSAKACHALADRHNKLMDTIAFMPRSDLLAQYLPVVNASLLSFSAQCYSLPMRVTCPFFDGEIGCNGGRDERFVVRKFPHVAFRSQQPARLGHIMQRVQQQSLTANATVWDVLASVRSCRERLPHKCAIGTLHSRICPRHCPPQPMPSPRTHLVFFLNGRSLEVRNVSENEIMPARFLLLNYADSTVDLLA